MNYRSVFQVISSGSSVGRLSLESISLEDDIINPNTGEVAVAGGDDEGSTEFVEAVQEAEEISAQVDEIQKTNDAIDTGEQVAAIGQQIQNADRPATLEEAALIQAGVAQTVAAAGGDNEDIADVVGSVNATESNGGYSIAMEGFSDTLKKMWQGVKDFVARVVQGIKNTFNRMWNSTAGVLKRAKKLKELLDKKKDELRSSDAKIEKWQGIFDTLSETGKGKFDLKGAYDTYSKQYEKGKISGIWTNLNESIAKLTEYANSFKKEGKIASDNEDLSKKVKSKMDTLVNLVLSTDGVTDVSTGDQSVIGKGRKGKKRVIGLGNFALFAVRLDSSKNEASDLELINSFTAKGGAAKETWLPKVKEPKYNVSDISFSDLKTLPELVENCIKGLEDWYNKDSKKADDNIQKLKKTIDDNVKEINDSDDTAKKEAARISQRLFVLPTQLLRMSMDLCVHVIKTSNAMVTLGNLLAKEYKDKKDDK